MIKLEEVSSSELRRALDRGSRIAVVPFGSVEYQATHLPLGSDALLADFVGEAVAARLDAVLAPTIRVGCAEQHLNCLGTLSVSAETLRASASGIACSLIKHGFRAIALISTHGGNQDPLGEAARELNARQRDVVTCAPSGDVGLRPGRHSGVWLTSVMLAIRPDLVDVTSVEPALSDEVDSASADIGRDHLERFVSSIVRQIQDAVRRA